MTVAIFFYRGEGNYVPAAKQFSGVLNVQSGFSAVVYCSL